MTKPRFTADHRQRMHAILDSVMDSIETVKSRKKLPACYEALVLNKRLVGFVFVGTSRTCISKITSALPTATWDEDLSKHGDGTSEP